MSFLRVSATLRGFFAWSVLTSGVLAADVDYVRDIKPLLSHKCGACHGALRQEASLRLDAGTLILAGGDSGPVVAPGEAAASLLLERVAAEDPADRMPPEGEGEPLDAEQLALLTAWINQGAPYPADEAIPAEPAAHWAYQPVRRPDVPDVADPNGSQNPVDAFIAEQYAAHGVAPVAEADRRTLLRRVYLDLIGLPPTREEQVAFAADESPDAYEQFVERLLLSELHAERWARHWMDVWRYSDWDGFGKELRGSQRHLWRWRDWIIESLAADKPYDRMVREMLAADELTPTDEDALRATGYLARQHYKLNRDLWLDNTVEHTFKAFLATTLNCAKCHDHKYDPLPQTDYYAARAIFEPYQVRIDRVAGESDIEKDGLARAYDADENTPTFVYLRGNEKHPDEDHPISPSTPAIFNQPFVPARVDLPVAAWYPDLTGDAAQSVLAAARNKLADEREKLAQAEANRELASRQVATTSANPDTGENAHNAGVLVLQDEFDGKDSDRWTTDGGEWSWSDGSLRQTEVVSQRSELVANVVQPRDFIARVRFVIAGGQQWHSVGMSFDRTEAGESDGVYLSAHAGGPKVQVVHVRGQQMTYPSLGTRSLPVELNQELELCIAVQGELLNATVNGGIVLAYKLTRERREGRLSLWTFDSKAEFLSVELRALPEGAQLVTSVSGVPAASLDDVLADAQAAVDLGECRVAAATLAVQSLSARLAADLAQFRDGEGDPSLLAAEAARVEREHALAVAQLRLAEAQDELRLTPRKIAAGNLKADAADAAKKNAAAALAARDEASAACERTDAEYTPFSTRYPQTSTGRRAALAEWIAARENPLTARVAVNHVWMRHFGEPLVENVFDFGLRTPHPVHHELLDWLAAEFMESGWSMRHLHRLIVTSRTYRLASSSSEAHGSQPAGFEVDPENRLYWRANIQRLDAEVIRDCVLFVGGSLDLTRGGPDIDFTEGETVFRRSLYFRHAYEKQMRFLTIFDAASPNECYRRSESIVPQQALALANSPLAVEQSQRLAAALVASNDSGDASDLITAAFETILCRPPTDEERSVCGEYLESQLQSVTANDNAVARSRACTGLVHVLINHNDFVTVR